MRRWARLLAAAGALLPALARAAQASDVLDLRGGAIGELTGKALAVAHGLLAFLFVLSLVVELLRGPGQRRNYLGVVWRTLLVLALLQAYGFLAGSVVKQCTSLAQALASQDTVEKLFEKHRAAVAQSFGLGADNTAPASAPDAKAGSAPVTGGDDSKPGGIGGFLFDALIALMLVLGQAVQWVFAQLSRVLIGFFYAIGPLALVFYVPGLDAPGRWFRSLVTVSCWPIVSAVLLNLSGSVLARTEPATSGAGAVFGAIASSLLLCVLAFATPKVASALVGGVGNLLSEGASAATGVVSGAAAGGALGGVGRAAMAVAGFAASRGGLPASAAAGAARGSFTPAQPAARPSVPSRRNGHGTSR